MRRMGIVQIENEKMRIVEDDLRPVTVEDLEKDILFEKGSATCRVAKDSLLFHFLRERNVVSHYGTTDDETHVEVPAEVANRLLDEFKGVIAELPRSISFDEIEEGMLQPRRKKK